MSKEQLHLDVERLARVLGTIDGGGGAWWKEGDPWEEQELDVDQPEEWFLTPRDFAKVIAELYATIPDKP